MSSVPQVRVLPTADEVARAAAEEIVRVLAAAIAARGVAHWATTGGSAAPPVYRLLGAPPLREALDWSRVHVWWGDDRFVPVDHPLSNVLPLEQILLDSGGDGSDNGATASDVGQLGLGVRIPAGNLHPIPMSAAIGHGTGVVGAAAAYAAELAEAVPPGADGLPSFDLVWLGVGPDGHILSVFPGSAVWDAGTNVAPVPAPEHVEPHVERVTIHPRLLAAAGEVLVVTTGAGKASNVGRAWSGDDVRELPLRAARLPNAVWLLDPAAAAELTLS
ncbi:MAG TPA: 6-phosphogluconolactonase [Candidatus Limnocylindrales bacterium]|jgi:6-phosphogluconolactonase